MKKHLALLLALVMIVCAVTMAACAGRNNEDTSTNGGAQSVPTEPVKETEPTQSTQPDNNDENWSSDTDMEWSEGGQITTNPSTGAPTVAPTEAPTEAPTQKPTEKPTVPATQKPTEGNSADEEDVTGGDEWSSSSDIEWFE